MQKTFLLSLNVYIKAKHLHTLPLQQHFLTACVTLLLRDAIQLCESQYRDGNNPPSMELRELISGDRMWNKDRPRLCFYCRANGAKAANVKAWLVLCEDTKDTNK